MEFLHSLNPLYSLSGLAIGALVGFTGVGGGSLMTPVLVLLFGIHPATAVGTDLLYAGLTKISGTAVHGLNGAVDWRITRRLAAGSAPAAALTLLGLGYFGHNSKTANEVITTTLGFALIVTAVTLIFRAWLLARVASTLEKLNDGQIRLLTILLGAVLGVLVSISSVGAGAIGVTVLLMLYPKLPTVRIVGSDIAHAVPVDPYRRSGPLVHRIDRLAAARLAADRLHSGHCDRQPARLARAGPRVAAGAGGHARHCRRATGDLSGETRLQRSANASLAPSATKAPANARRIQVNTRGRAITWSRIEAANSP
jgi:uncharacterized membrane protein YfcA